MIVGKGSIELDQPLENAYPAGTTVTREAQAPVPTPEPTLEPTLAPTPEPTPEPIAPTPAPEFWSDFYGNSNATCAELDNEAEDGKSGYTRRRNHYRDNCIQKECKQKGLIWAEDQWKCEDRDEPVCSGKCVLR